MIARRLDGYEERPQQLEMAQLVSRAFVNKEHLIVEAGTGVGKSFAYLVAAIELVCGQAEKRVVVSTHTIALQEQLIEKDIPFLQKVMASKFKAELVKGRRNYLCLRRLESVSRRQDRLLTSQQELKTLWRVEDWAIKTREGSLRTVPFRVSPAVWQRVCSDRHSCQGRACPQFGKCFYQVSRRRMQAAQILVVNHALFFADLVLREGKAKLLPGYDAVVLDEAHWVEDVAGNHLGGRMSMGQVEYLLNVLYNPQTDRGFLAGMSGPAQSAQRVVEAARSANEQFFGELGRWQERFGRSNGRVDEPNVVSNVLSPALRELAGQLRELSLKQEEQQLELAGYATATQELAEQLEVLLEQKKQGAVYWLESETARRGRSGRRRWRLACAPVQVGQDLQRMLWSKVDSVVLTSATLSSGARGQKGQAGEAADDFGFIRARLGLKQAKRARLGSPFDFARQVKVYVEPGLGNPNDREGFLPRACQAIKKYLRMSRGKAFVLFTNWQMMGRAEQALSDFFAEEGLTLLVQKPGTSRTRLLNSFRQDVDSVLFGTASFWGGVDVRGQALSNVIITKLPFAVPDEPLTEARLEQIRREGGNPFTEYQLPEAILRFKQGFGRLIRSREDRGIVVILDGRVVRQWYGRRFLEALPSCEIVIVEQGQ